MNDLPLVVASTAVGKTVTVEVWRKNKKESVQVKIGELKDEEKVVAAKADGGGLGMSLEEITPERAKAFGLTEKSGLVVVQVEDGSPAGEAGVRPGDVILEMDQTPLRSLEEFSRKVEEFKKGDTILLLIKRQKATLFLTLKVAE